MSTDCISDFIRANKNISIMIEINLFYSLKERCGMDNDRRGPSFYSAFPAIYILKVKQKKIN